MASKARTALDLNLKDIEKLLALHQQAGGTLPGRRYGLEVLNKSAIVLITSFWEAYCEDIASEALAHIVKHARTADLLPKSLKQQIAKELKEDKHQLAIWQVADGNWKAYLQTRLADLKSERDRNWNTPKSEKLDVFFETVIGIQKISDSWYWPKMSVESARKKLDDYVILRGEIAHRGKAAKSVKLSKVRKYRDFIERLANKTESGIASHVKSITGKSPW